MAGNSGDESVPNETCVTNDTQQEQQVSESHTNVFITPEGDIKYLCSVCNQLFKYEAGLRKHEARHKPPGGYTCSECNGTFLTDTDRNLHKEIVHKIFKCLICNMKFDSELEFKSHTAELHEGRDREYLVCDVCGAQFRQKNQLKIHCESRCGTVRCYTCKQCNSKFMTQFTLNTHMLIHAGEKKFLCNFCGSSFLSKGQLKIHERSHTKEKPYECKVCGKAFPYRESLVTHSSLHTGIKSYQCECCSRQFSCIGNLIKHRRTRPETCGLPKYKNIKCAPRASTKGDLKKGKGRRKRTQQVVRNTTVPPTPPKSMVIVEEYDESCDVDADDSNNHYSTTSNKVSLKVEPSYKTSENNVVYITANDDYITTKSDEIIMASSSYPQSEQIIVLETQEILMSPDEEYPIIVENSLVKQEHEILLDGEVQQYQIISADELIETNSDADHSFIVETFECEYCDTQFMSNDLLLDHLRDSHAIDSRSYDETIVTVEEEDSSVKETEVEDSIVEAPIAITSTTTNTVPRKKHAYSCKKCGKNYNSRSTLNDHQHSNCGQSPLYKCSYDGCGKAMHSLGSLKTHELIHSGTLAHGCRFCEKRFRTQGQVKVHERSHNGEKPFKCSECSKSFAHRESLITHVSVHTGLKRFACQGCDKRFSCISNLQAHRRTHRNVCGQLPLDTKAQHVYVLAKAKKSKSK